MIVLGNMYVQLYTMIECHVELGSVKRQERKWWSLWKGTSWWRLAVSFEGQATLYKWQERVYIPESGRVKESVGWMELIMKETGIISKFPFWREKVVGWLFIVLNYHLLSANGRWVKRWNTVWWCKEFQWQFKSPMSWMSTGVDWMLVLPTVSLSQLSHPNTKAKLYPFPTPRCNSVCLYLQWELSFPSENNTDSKPSLYTILLTLKFMKCHCEKFCYINLYLQCK